jgi:hypothetical protein
MNKTEYNKLFFFNNSLKKLIFKKISEKSLNIFFILKYSIEIKNDRLVFKFI